jgi:DNA repair ATPase RecN
LSTGGKYFRFTRENHKQIYDSFENLPSNKKSMNKEIKSEEFSNREELLKFVKQLLNNNNIEMPPKEELRRLQKEMQNLGDGAECTEFLSTLCFFTAQASRNVLEDLIKTEIEISCGSSITRISWKVLKSGGTKLKSFSSLNQQNCGNCTLCHMLPTYLRRKGKK